MTNIIGGTTDDNTVIPIHIEPSSKAFQVSRAIHYRVMHSNQWMSHKTFIAIPNANSRWLHVKVHADTNCHLGFKVTTESKAWYYIYENPTLTNDGTAIDRVAINRETPTASQTLVYHTPTITNTGTQLESGMIGGEGRADDSPGTSASAGYWLLKKGESYLIGVNNQDANAKDINVMVSWHEH